MIKKINFEYIAKIYLISLFVMILYAVLADFNFYKSYKADDKKSLAQRSEYGISKKYNIQIVTTAYLGEMQASNYFCISAQKMGMDCRVLVVPYQFSKNVIFRTIYSVINYITKPDIIIDFFNFSLKDDQNIFHHPNYNAYVMTQYDSNYDHVRKKEEFLLWKDYYSGYVLFGNDDAWLRKFFKQYDAKYDESKVIKDNYIAAIALDFKPRNRDKLVFAGSRWDKRRGSDHFKEIFKLLDERSYFEVYGPQNYWTFLKNSFKGNESDGNKLMHKLQEAGISLVFHGANHWTSNEPSSARIFEAAAAGNIIISDEFAFVKQTFGNNVFYVDPLGDAKEVVKQIDEIVAWVKNNPEQANDKAYKSYKIFTDKFSSTKTILNIIKYHEKIKKQSGDPIL